MTGAASAAHCSINLWQCTRNSNRQVCAFFPLATGPLVRWGQVGPCRARREQSCLLHVDDVSRCWPPLGFKKGPNLQVHVLKLPVWFGVDAMGWGLTSRR